MAEEPTSEPAPAPSQQPVKDAPWITQFPKSVRGDDLMSWGATGEEMIENNRKIRAEHATMKSRLADLTSGVPESEEEYAFSIADDVKDLVNVEELKGFRTLAKDLGLSVTKAQKFVDFEAARRRAAVVAYDKAKTERTKATMEELRAEYKDKTDAVLADAFRTVTAIGGKELHDELERSLGSNPLLVRAFIKIAPLFTEAGARPASGGGGGGNDEDIDLSEVYSRSINGKK